MLVEIKTVNKEEVTVVTSLDVAEKGMQMCLGILKILNAVQNLENAILRFLNIL